MRRRGTLKLIRPSVSPSVCQSVCHKNFNLAHIFWSINDRALIFGMHDPCDKPFLLIPCGDLDLDLWPTSRSNLLPGGGPQFFEFACCSLILYYTWSKYAMCQFGPVKLSWGPRRGHSLNPPPFSPLFETEKIVSWQTECIDWNDLKVCMKKCSCFDAIWK